MFYSITVHVSVHGLVSYILSRVTASGILVFRILHLKFPNIAYNITDVCGPQGVSGNLGVDPSTPGDLPSHQEDLLPQHTGSQLQQHQSSVWDTSEGGRIITTDS